MTTRKRNRGRGPGKETPAQEDKPVISDELIEETYNYVKRVVAPRVFADLARRLGSTGARPADFACGCAQSYLDGLPVCDGERATCRFAGRVSDDERDAHFSADAKARYDAAWRAAMDARKKTAFRATP